MPARIPACQISVSEAEFQAAFVRLGCKGSPQDASEAVKRIVIAACRAEVDPTPQARKQQIAAAPMPQARPLPEPRDVEPDRKCLAANDKD